MERRPSGVTVLSGTSVLAGILMIISGSILSFAAPSLMAPKYGMMGMQVKMPFLASAMVYDVGMVVFALGVASIFTAYGLLRGDPWARKAMIAFTSAGIAIFAIVAALFNIVEIANLIINGSILLYLFKPNVRAFFRGQPAQTQASSH
ncbi:MAG TPA: hypothetical protein VJ792_05630 [Candidatus Nitrosotalea sp.]|nr:hypothetical protein [Candidatus Nitrosotalea sp.]